MCVNANQLRVAFKVVDEEAHLREAVRWKKKARLDRVVRLGETLNDLMENKIAPAEAKFNPVAQHWNQLLPDELGRHCEIIDFSGGQLKVKVDSPSHRYELQLCSEQLLESLQERCSGARIKKIKVVLG